MKTALLRRGFGAACAFSLFLVSACGVGDLVVPTKGRMAITVKWPAKKTAFTIQAIPEATARIDVTIRGEGIADETPLMATVKPDGAAENASTFVDVPIGPKLVQGAAYDAAGELTAVGQVAIAVQPNALVEAHLVLQAVDKDVKPIPSPTPTATPTGTPDPATPSPTPTPQVPLEPIRIVEALAGDGVAGAIDARDAMASRFYYPRSLVYDRERNVLFVADSGYRLIRRLDLATGVVTTVAGRPSTAGAPPIGLPPALASGESGVPSGLAIGPDGDLYFCDRENHMIRKITAAGEVKTVAGTGREGYVDGAVGAAQFAYPSDLSIDGYGNIYVADTHNNRVRRITGDQVTTVAGSGATHVAETTRINVAPATLGRPVAVEVEPTGKGVYIAEGEGRRVLRYDVATGAVVHVAGSGQLGTSGEGGPAVAADIGLPQALVIDVDGELLIADGWALKTGPITEEGPASLLGAASRVLRLTRDGRLVRVAGSTTGNAYAGDGSDARQAVLNNPSGLAVDGTGRIFIGDSYNNRIRVIQPPIAAPAPSPTAPVVPAPPDPSASPTPAPAPSPSPAGTPAP